MVLLLKNNSYSKRKIKKGIFLMWPSPVIFIWRPLSSLCVCIKAMWKWLCLPCITFFLNYVFCSGDVAVLLDFSMVCDVCLVCVCTFSWVRVSSRLRNLCLQLWSSVWSCSDRAARSRAQSSSSRSARMPLTSPCRERFCMRADTHTHTETQIHRYIHTPAGMRSKKVVNRSGMQ